LTFWNQVSSVGAFLMPLSIFVFIVNAVLTARKPAGLANEDPWDARTLEWMIPCPPPIHNFDEIPTVHSIDEFWHRKYVEDEKTGKLVPAQAGAAPSERPGRAEAAERGSDPHAAHAIHLPSPSFWPLVAAAGLPTMAYGVLYSWWVVGLGVLVLLTGFYGWALEPSVAE